MKLVSFLPLNRVHNARELKEQRAARWFRALHPWPAKRRETQELLLPHPPYPSYAGAVGRKGSKCVRSGGELVCWIESSPPIGISCERHGWGLICGFAPRLDLDGIGSGGELDAAECVQGCWMGKSM